MNRSRRPSYFADDASRGLDIIRLQIGVQTRAIRMGILMVLMGSIGFGGIWFFFNVTALEIGDILAHMAAWVSVHWLDRPEQIIPLKTDNGWTNFYAHGVLRSAFVADSVANGIHHALIASAIAAVLCIPLTVLVIRVARSRGRDVYSDSIARGTPLATPRELRRAVRKAGASGIRICDVPLPEEALNRHILLLGSTRSGKSLSIRRMLREIERRGDMAIVFDKVGDFVKEFYQPDRQDLLMNPLDRRSAPWSPWCEGDTPIDHMRIARSLIPKSPNDRNMFFQEGARTLLVALLDRVGAMEGRSIESFLDAAYRWDREKKAAFLEGTDAAKHFIGDSNAGHDVDATMGVFTQGLRYLPRGSGSGKDRSIRSFIRDVVRIREEGPEALLAEIDNIDPTTGEVFSGQRFDLANPIGKHRREEIEKLTRVIGAGQTPWMFISSETEKMDALMPLLACWIDLAVTSVLSLDPREDRRIWIILDEWHTLGQLARLQDILTEGAKYGACVVAGTQNIGQIRKNYGPDSAEAMLSLFNTKAIFRVPETVSAEWASRYMGDLIWNQARESVRYGTSETMDGASIADGRVVERKVMPHEIIDLPDRTAFLSIAGDFPIARVNTAFDRKTDPARVNRPAFVPRAFADLAWSDAKPIPQPKRPAEVRRADHRPAEPRADTDRDHPFHPDNRLEGDPGPRMPVEVPAPATPDPKSSESDRSQPPVRDQDQPEATNDRNVTKANVAPEAPTDDSNGVSGGADSDPSGEQFDLFDQRSLGEKIDTLDAEGLSQREIANRLNITRYKVQQHQELKKSGDA